MRIAPDKSDPLPRPVDGGNDGNGGRNRNPGAGLNVLGPGGVKSLAEDMVDGFGGSLKGWMKDIREPYVYKFNYGRGGNGNHNGNGGDDRGKDPTGTDPGTRPDVLGNQHSRMAPMAMASQLPPGLLASSATAAQPQFGMLGAAPAQPAADAQAQLPPEILALIRARQMRA